MRNPKPVQKKTAAVTAPEVKTVPDPAIAKLQKDVETLAKALNMALDGKPQAVADTSSEALTSAATALREASQALANRPSTIALKVIRGKSGRALGMIASTDEKEIAKMQAMLSKPNRVN